MFVVTGQPTGGIDELETYRGQVYLCGSFLCILILKQMVFVPAKGILNAFTPEVY